MSAKTEKKFRKMHKKQIGNIAGTDFKLYHKKVDAMLFKKNLIITLLAFLLSLSVYYNIMFIFGVISAGS